MANDLTTAQGRVGKGNSATPCSPTTLTAAIPAWVDLRELDGSLGRGYQLPIPAGAAPALREAAMLHAQGMTPATPEERQGVLLGLRSGTILRDEAGVEAEASLKLLRVHLDDVPLDILQQACRAYCNAPGRRFFPRSAGELRSFINPLVFDRHARAMRLMRLADQADREEARAAELAADPADPEAVAEICRRYRVGSFAAEQPGAAPHAPSRVPGSAYRERPCREPNREDYLRMGVSADHLDVAPPAANEERKAA